MSKLSRNKLSTRKTPRGFKTSDFLDRYDNPCSIQESSLAFENAIWFGVDEANPQRLVKDQGWQPFDIPADVSLTTRMHLTQAQVKMLLPVLQKFAKTGRL